MTRSEEELPSVDLAYEFVKPSYDLAERRLTAVDTRIQALLTFMATITLAAPIIVRSILTEPNFSSGFFIAALVVFGVALIIGGVFRSIGGLTFIDPTILYQQWLHYSEWEFRKNIIWFAGEHMRENAKLINKKGWAGNIITGLLIGQVLLFVWWAT